MQALVFELTSRGRFPDSHISNFSPFYENDKSWVFENGFSPRIHSKYTDFHSKIGWRLFNTHLYRRFLPDQGKFIYVIRSPKDACASFYHHLSHQAVEDGGYRGSLDDFVKQWCQGDIAFGGWGEHLKSYLESEMRDNILVITYEEMIQDLGKVARRVALYLEIVVDDEQVASFLPRLKLESMKKNIHLYTPKSVKWLETGDGFQFIRNGKVGDSENLFNDSHQQDFLNYFTDLPSCCAPYFQLK